MPNSGNLTNGIGQSGDAGTPDRLIEDNGILFAPRFGLTYDITGNQSFIFRAGGGVFYDRYEGNISFALISNPPTTSTPRIDFGRLQEIDPATALLAPSDLNAQAVAGQVPTTYNFNAGFQKKLPGGVIWDIAYVGSIANHLPRQVNLNAVPYGARFLPENQDPTLPASTLPGQNAYDANFLRPYQGYGNINLRLYDANSNYHGMQTQVDRRFANGLFLNANYTFSKALDTQDLNTDFSRPDQHDRQANYGPAAFDRRHIFNFNWVYQLPKNEGVNAFVSGLINNWQVSGGYRLESGLPYGLTWSVNGISTQTNIAGSNTENANRPIISGDPGSGYDVSDPYQQVALGIYSQSPVGSLGLESGRNYLNRAPINNVDLSVEKGFGLGGGRRLAFRVDAFNVFNHTQFDAVANNIQFQALDNNTIVNLPYDASGNLVRTNGFGAVTSVRSPRVLQLLARFQFLRRAPQRAFGAAAGSIRCAGAQRAGTRRRQFAAQGIVPEIDTRGVASTSCASRTGAPGRRRYSISTSRSSGAPASTGKPPAGMMGARMPSPPVARKSLVTTSTGSPSAIAAPDGRVIATASAPASHRASTRMPEKPRPRRPCWIDRREDLAQLPAGEAQAHQQVVERHHLEHAPVGQRPGRQIGAQAAARVVHRDVRAGHRREVGIGHEVAQRRCRQETADGRLQHDADRLRLEGADLLQRRGEHPFDGGIGLHRRAFGTRPRTSAASDRGPHAFVAGFSRSQRSRGGKLRRPTTVRVRRSMLRSTRPKARPFE